MDLFTDSDTLARLDEHEEIGVRRLAQDLRTLSSELLLTRMEAQGADRLGERRHVDLPRFLWRAVHDAESTLDPGEAAELAQLASLANGWWKFGPDGGVELIALDEWMEGAR